MFPNVINTKLKKLKIPCGYIVRENLDFVQNSDYTVSYNSVGEYSLVFCTKYKRKKVCYLINYNLKPYTYSIIDDFVICCDEFHTDTLLIGKYINDLKLFIVDDIITHKSLPLTNTNLNDRLLLINDFIHNVVDNNNFNFITKKYYSFEYISDLYKRVIPSLNFKCDGLLFKHNHSIFDNNIITVIDDSTNENKEMNYDDRDFILKKTDLPDIFNIYDGNKMISNNIALILTYNKSKYMKDVFKRHKDNNGIRFRCEYNTKFKKWVPSKKL
jgi:hypothetical protein